MHKQGDIINMEKGIQIILGEQIGSGAEGCVFNIDKLINSDNPADKFVLKILHEDKMDNIKKREVFKRFKYLQQLSNKNKVLQKHMTMPLLFGVDNLCYLMKKTTGQVSLNKYIKFPLNDFDNWYKNEFPFKKRITIAKNLFNALRDIHLCGLIFTDLSPNNIMAHPSKNMIGFIDVDNLRSKNDIYMSVVGTNGYTAPEVLRTVTDDMIDSKYKSSSGKISQDSDIFAAAVIIFELIMLHHPFKGDEISNGPPELEDDALNIKTDYIFKKDTTNTSTFGLTPKFYELTSKELRKLFYRTFVDGLNNPHLRPTAEEFLVALDSMLNQTITCENCNFSQIYQNSEINKCINCDELVKPIVSMYIYHLHHGITRENLINNFDKLPMFDVRQENLTIDGKDSLKHFLINRIDFDFKNYNKKICKNHFENSNDFTPIYEVEIDGNSSKLSFKIGPNTDIEYKQAHLISKKTKAISMLNLGKEFDYKEYAMIIEKVPYCGATIDIFVTFREN